MQIKSTTRAEMALVVSSLRLFKSNDRGRDRNVLLAAG